MFEESDALRIEPLTRWASVVATFGAPLAAAVIGLRRRMVVRSALIVAGAIMSLSCLSLLFAVTLTDGSPQVIATCGIAATALSIAFRVKPNAARGIPTRPDRFA